MKLDLGSDFEEMFGSDPSREEDGAWMDVPGKEGWAVQLRSQASKKVRERAQRLMRKHTPLLRAGKSIAPEAVDEDKVELLIEVIVVGWRGFNGTPFTKSNLRAVLEQYPQFREFCYDWSNDAANYRIPSKEDVAGNSEAGTKGSSDTAE